MDVIFHTAYTTQVATLVLDYFPYIAVHVLTVGFADGFLSMVGVDYDMI